MTQITSDVLEKGNFAWVRTQFPGEVEAAAPSLPGAAKGAARVVLWETGHSDTLTPEGNNGISISVQESERNGRAYPFRGIMWAGKIIVKAFRTPERRRAARVYCKQ